TRFSAASRCRCKRRSSYSAARRHAGPQYRRGRPRPLWLSGAAHFTQVSDIEYLRHKGTPRFADERAGLVAGRAVVFPVRFCPRHRPLAGLRRRERRGEGRARGMNAVFQILDRLPAPLPVRLAGPPSLSGLVRRHAAPRTPCGAVVGSCCLWSLFEARVETRDALHVSRLSSPPSDLPPDPLPAPGPPPAHPSGPGRADTVRVEQRGPGFVAPRRRGLHAAPTSWSSSAWGYIGLDCGPCGPPRLWSAMVRDPEPGRRMPW